MLRISRVFLPVLLLVAPLAGCIFDPKTEPPPPPRNEYAQPTAPESLVVNLQVSYRRQEIDKYADLLATDFRFFFQPVDQAQNGESWNADQDSTGTDALFRTPEVSTIRIELVHGPAEEPTEIGFDPDVLKIRINNVQLEVDQVSGTTLLVTDVQDMYFRPGRDAFGEDPERYYILEWRDIPPAGGAPTIAPLAYGDGAESGDETVSWGALRSRFASTN
jgi:hypothetical protein